MKNGITIFLCLISWNILSASFTSNSGPYQANEILSNLSSPWGLAFSPSKLLFVTEKTGAIKVFKDGIFQYNLAGLPRDIATVGQGGLLDIVFHPEFQKKPYLYLSYTTKTRANPHDGINTRVSRFTLSNEKTLTSEKILVQGGFGTDGAHFGSRLAFDSKGYLFITIGERHHKEKAQELSYLNGKILRLHDDGRIPDDNPFVGTPHARGEIFSLGHRNPQGLDIHPLSNTPFVSEHGPSGYDAYLPGLGSVGKADEVNAIFSGKNYGWPILFGSPKILPWTNRMINFARNPNIQAPLVEFTKPDGIAPSGSAFYTGKSFPSWENDLFVTALRGYILRLKITKDGQLIESEKIIPNGFYRLRDVTTGPNGSLFAIAANGIIEIKP